MPKGLPTTRKWIALTTHRVLDEECERFCVPLFVYTRKQIQELMATLEARGVRFEG